MAREIVNGQLYCNSCKQWKDVKYFQNDKSRIPPYKYTCKTCTSKRRGVKHPTVKCLDTPIPAKHAYCRKCGEIKLTKDFIKRDGKSGTCKACATPEQIASKERTYRKIQEYQRRKRSEQFGTKHEELDLPSIYAQFGNVCAYCGKKARLDADHFVPISQGGGYVITNIVPSCLQCNAAKNDSDPADWLVGRTDLYYSILNYFFQYMTEDQIYNKFNSGEWKVL